MYISEEDIKVVEREMYDAGINAEEFTKNQLLAVHQVPNIAGYSNITQLELEKLSQFAASMD